jgi:hypothetical protein
LRTTRTLRREAAKRCDQFFSISGPVSDDRLLGA